jgi:hypothetical protein
MRAWQGEGQKEGVNERMTELFNQMVKYKRILGLSPNRKTGEKGQERASLTQLLDFAGGTG